MPIAASALPTATMIGCSAISAVRSVTSSRPARNSDSGSSASILASSLTRDHSDTRRLALDVIVDRADAQAAQREPAGTGPAARHGFGDDGFRGPVKFHAGPTAANEEIGIAAAEKIEPEIEGGSRRAGQRPVA